MHITIAETLKSLRAKRGNLQDALAAHCGVTSQSVSKWERGEGYPDITLLPAIAAFYDVTVDELLGVGEIRKQARVRELLDRERELVRIGDTVATLAHTQAAYREFPNDYQIMVSYMNAMFCLYQPDIEDEFYHCPEIIAVGERVLAGCADDELRWSALQMVCCTYAAIGQRDKAREYANTAPDYWVTSNALLESVSEGDELLRQTRENLACQAELMYGTVRNMLRAGEFSVAERICALETMVGIFALVFGGDDFGFYVTRVIEFRSELARLYATLQNREKTLENLGAARELTRSWDETRPYTHTSLLLRGCEYKPEERFGTAQTERERYAALSEDAAFDFVRGAAEFDAVRGD
ncbi:MAG: helix-turn-helix domain-containing protein [Oscillospiraceae bacterium]|jgi:transcriptional regulator with XRE-family HTH domain|nr:helix-turn-helix domain-containing protein [Oscillospiraceae bacterium]